MADQVEEVKSKVDIVQLVSEHVSLKKAGRNYKGLCPFHGEKTPSFMVNPELQIFKCFGCGEGGDVFTFLQKIEGMEFGEALKALADKAGVKLTSYKPTQAEEIKEKLLKINNLVSSTYHFLLTQHKSGQRAREYLKDRGVKEESVEKFKLGYAPAEWRFLEDYLVRKKGYNLAEIVRTGLIVEGKNYDRFRERVMFPLANPRGEIVGFAGRVLPGVDLPAGRQVKNDVAKYVNTPETEVYHKSELLYGFDITRGEIKMAGFAVVVEGELDMISSYQAGVKNVVAIKGSALTERQVELIRRVTENVVLALDADLAGNSAARRGIEIAEKSGMYVRTVNWALAGGGAKDAADIAMADEKKWQELVGNPISIYSFYIDSAIKKFGLTTEGKSRIVADVLPIFKTIENAVRQDEYLKELAVKTETDLEAVRSQMEKYKVSSIKYKEDSKIDNESLKKSRREVVEEYLVGMAVRNKQIDQLTGEPVKKLFKGEFWIKAIEALNKYKSVKKLPAEIREKVELLMLVEDDMDEEQAGREWKKSVKDLEEIGIREEIETAGLTDKNLQKLTKRLSDLTKTK